MCCRIQKLIMVGILTNGSLNVSWYRSKLHSLLSVFCVFNLYILSLSMQGACAIEVHFVWRIMHAEQVLLCFVYINVCGDSSDNTMKPYTTVITQAHSERVWKSHGRNTHTMCFWVHTYHFIAAYITPTLRHLKREHDLYQNINHHSLYVNKFRISPFTMRTSTRAGNATFPELINHTHWVIWQSTPNTGWGAAIPRAQTHTI